MDNRLACMRCGAEVSSSFQPGRCFAADCEPAAMDSHDEAEPARVSGYVVKYKVAGFDGERTTPVYPDERTAREHADDIRSFEGVQYAVVAPAEEKSST